MLHFSASDIAGGAARAAYRLHRSLREAGVASGMCVRWKQSEDASVQEVPFVPWYSSGRRMVWRIPWTRKRLLPIPSSTFNLDVVSGIDMRKIDGFRPGGVDAVCLHWITDFLGPGSIRTLYDRLRCPLLWVLMDIEPLTGGCHYAFGCDGFTRSCGRCPQLGSNNDRDRSRTLWERKRGFLRDLPVVFIAPTGWVESRIRESSLFGGHRVERIPLAVDTSVFHPGDQADARDRLGLPRERKILFFGCSLHKDPRKGMSYLEEALHILAPRLRDDGGSQGVDRVLLLVAGVPSGDWLDSLPFRRVEMGHIGDDSRLALAYRASDMFVCPSVEEAGPMMIPESMLCGTPVVAFDTGGAPDLIRPGGTGYLARYKDSGDLAEGICRLLMDRHPGQMREEAGVTAKRLHAPDVVAARYVNLCAELSGGSP
jgi:glycosyltransferase involved in cell wall biosynthesis